MRHQIEQQQKQQQLLHPDTPSKNKGSSQASSSSAAFSSKAKGTDGGRRGAGTSSSLSGKSPHRSPQQQQDQQQQQQLQLFNNPTALALFYQLSTNAPAAHSPSASSSLHQPSVADEKQLQFATSSSHLQNKNQLLFDQKTIKAGLRVSIDIEC